MFKKLGKCPFSKDGEIEVRKIEVNAKPTKLYACSNAHWHFEHDMCEVKLRLYSSKAKKEYFKWPLIDKEYGLRIVWDIDINEDEE